MITANSVRRTLTNRSVEVRGHKLVLLSTKDVANAVEATFSMGQLSDAKLVVRYPANFPTGGEAASNLLAAAADVARTELEARQRQSRRGRRGRRPPR